MSSEGEGKGSVFFFELPVVRAVTHEEGAIAAAFSNQFSPTLQSTPENSITRVQHVEGSQRYILRERVSASRSKVEDIDPLTLPFTRGMSLRLLTESSREQSSREQLALERKLLTPNPSLEEEHESKDDDWSVDRLVPCLSSDRDPLYLDAAKASMDVHSNSRRSLVQLSQSKLIDTMTSPPELLLPTILAVDDSGPSRKVLCRLLHARGLSVQEAVDGREAVTKVATSMHSGMPYDMILMDYQMPVLDGPSAAKEMRGMGYTGIIVGVTGNALALDIDTFKSSGANHVITKPFNMGAFEQIISGMRMSSIRICLFSFMFFSN